MSDRDPFDPLAALERIFDDWRAATDPDGQHREAWDHIAAEIAAARSAIAETETHHQKQLETLRAQHAAELDLATHSSRAHQDIAVARAAVDAEAARAQADRLAAEKEAERRRLLAEVAELREEVSTLSSFDATLALGLYSKREEADEADASTLRAECEAARARVARAEADARKSGARTALEMAQMDIALEQARAERDRAEHALASAEARLTNTREKLAAWRTRV